MLKVEVNGNIEKALKIMKHKVRNVKQVEQLRNRQFFEKPSVKRRAEIKKAVYIEDKYGDHGQ